MRKEIPAWLAAVVIVIVVIIIAAVYFFAGKIRPQGTAGPTTPEIKAKMWQYIPKMKGQTPPTSGGYPAHGVYKNPPYGAPMHGR